MGESAMMHRRRREDWTRGEIGQKFVERQRSPQACLHTPQKSRSSQTGQCSWSPRFSSTEEKKMKFNSSEAARARQLDPTHKRKRIKFNSNEYESFKI
jgi:hypothetical protein